MCSILRQSALLGIPVLVKPPFSFETFRGVDSIRFCKHFRNPHKDLHDFTDGTFHLNLKVM